MRSPRKSRRLQATMKFRLYRYHPETDAQPHMQDVDLDIDPAGKMLLDALLVIKAQDETLSLRRSCREGVCGSDAVNVNGKNRLACITPLSDLKEPIEVRPLPGLSVIRDLIVDMEPFYRQYRSIKPWLINDEPEPEVERLQSPADRALLDGGQAKNGRILSPAMARMATFPHVVGFRDRTMLRDMPWGLGMHLKHVLPAIDDCGTRATPGAIGLANSGVWIDGAMFEKIRGWRG